MTVTAQQLSALIEVDATGRLFWKPRNTGWDTRNAGKPVGVRMRGGYRRIRINGRAYEEHRVLWALHTGSWPVGEIDHINGDRSDNRIVNLRDVNRLENNHNAALAKNNKSGCQDVCAYRGKWMARIGDNNVRRYLGLFETKEAAIAARKAAEIELGYHSNHGRSPILEGATA